MTQPVVSSPALPKHGLLAWTRVNYGTWRGWVRHVLALAALQMGQVSPFLQADPTRARRLVFVCLGNINRSAFASQKANSLGEPAVSIGLSTTTGAPATPQAIAQASIHGVSLDQHKATNFDDYAFRDGDVLIVMELRHAHALVARGIPADAISPLGMWATPRRLHIHDPHTLSSAYFATCFSLIESAVRALVHARRQVSS